MNRRSFLGSLVAFGALPVLSKLPLEFPDTFNRADAVSLGANWDARLLLEGDGSLLQFSGVQSGLFTLLRGEKVLQRFHVSPGGFFTWAARGPMEELLFTQAKPLSIIVPQHGECEMVYRSAGQLFGKRFARGNARGNARGITVPLR